MPITRAARGSYLETHWYGIVTADDLREHYTQLIANPCFLETRRTLARIDVTEAQFTGADFAMIHRSLRRPETTGLAWRAAVVAREPVHLGVAHQFAAYGEGLVVLRVFPEETEALAWLLADAG